MISFRLFFAFFAPFAGVAGHSDCEPGIYSREGNRWEEYRQKVKEARRDAPSCKVEGGCSTCYGDVIARDLKTWEGGVTKEAVQAAGKVARSTKYQVINGTLYRSEECMFPFRCVGIEHFLLQLAGDLPDTEFVVNVRDWPQASKHGPPLPVFSFSKVPSDHWDIMYPAWAFWAGGPAINLYPRGLGRWDLLRDSLAAAAYDNPWSKKLDKAFFRGSRTSGERDALVLLSRKCPAVVDAEYTKNQGWKSDADTLGKAPAEEASLEEHCKYKVLFNYRGVAASFRLKHLFLCRSLVVHVGDAWQEFFYPALKPWLHYVPLSTHANEEELMGLLHFLQENQDIVRSIAETGADFISSHLRLEDISCYWSSLLRSYTALLDYTVAKDPTLMEVKPRVP